MNNSIRKAPWRVCATGVALLLSAIGFAGPKSGGLDAGQAPITPTNDWVGSSKIPAPEIPGSGWKPSTFTIPVIAKAPVIDGKLNDPCWKQALHAPAFFRFQSTDPVREQTEAWICADKTHLYIAVHCLDSHPELIRAHETQREGDLSHDDSIQFVIDGQGTRRNVRQFTVSARGTQQTQLDGGTADNLSWSGDWTAATQRTADGWTVEMAIPFSIIKYPRGANRFPLAVLRSIPRETNAQIWPYMPVAQATSNPMPALCDFVGIEPPYYPPHAVFLPYALASADSKTISMRSGLDVKYPISTTLTGLATIYPDFQTIEQAVTDLSFSYTEKFVPDRRPFFAEGNQALQDSWTFYSQRIPLVDAGVKVTGKQGPTGINVLGTTAHDTGQTSFLAKIDQDEGRLSNVYGIVEANNQNGQTPNQIGQFGGAYGWKQGSRQYTINSSVTGSWLDGGPSDHSAWFQFQTDGARNKMNGNFFLTETGKNFTNELGLVPETDLRGTGFGLWKQNAFDKGAVERTYFGVNANTYNHMTGGFFHDSLSESNFISLRNGTQFEVDVDAGKRDDFHDNTISSSVNWNTKTLYQQGGFLLQEGHRQNQRYEFMDLSQGYLISRKASLKVDFNRVMLGSQIDTQTVLSGTYRLNPQDAIGGRLVQRDGKINAYLSFGRRSRHGTDVFLLLGDPNADTWRSVITLKLVRPF